jgi:ABC-type sugar transport system substrate-binding protein
MRRREFLGALGGAAAMPLAARAQRAGKVWRMGFIAHGHERFHDELIEGLREYGYEEGRNLIVERRYARGQAERFKESAAELVRLNVDVIIVDTTPAALAVMNATKTIPIVLPNAIDPLNSGLIDSLAHPGRNLTGGAQLTAEVSGKRFGNTKESGAGTVARGRALEFGQSRARIFLERDARCGARTGSNASIPRGARTEGLCGCLRRDRRRAPRRAPRLAGCVGKPASKGDRRLRNTEAAAEHV